MLGHSVGTRTGILHRTALVDDDGATKIGFVFVLANVKAIGLTKELPIDRPRLISGNVRSMFLELDARADVMRSMQSATDPFDNSSSKQLQMGDSR